MKKIVYLVLFIFLAAASVQAAQSTILEVEGKACMGEDKSRKQTEQEAVRDAKRTATEQALTHVKSETQVKDFTVEKDLVNAYSSAAVKVLQELEKAWYKDADAGNCYRIKIRAEIVPDTKAMATAAGTKKFADDPSLPLSVQLWTDKREYKQGEMVKIYIKGNKPFHARLLYKDASGQVVQLLPNPYRSEDYFNGGVTYEIPSTQDRFELEVSPPFGKEDIVVYASTTPLGDIKLKAPKDAAASRCPRSSTSRPCRSRQAGNGKKRQTEPFKRTK